MMEQKVGYEGDGVVPNLGSKRPEDQLRSR